MGPSGSLLGSSGEWSGKSKPLANDLEKLASRFTIFPGWMRFSGSAHLLHLASFAVLCCFREEGGMNLLFRKEAKRISHLNRRIEPQMTEALEFSFQFSCCACMSPRSIGVKF